MAYPLAYSTNAYTKHSLAEALAEIRRLGFEGVEILADEPHAFPPLSGTDVRRALQGLRLSNINGNTVRGRFTPSLIDPDPAARRERIDYTLRTIDMARALGAGNVCTSTGYLPQGMAPEQADGFLRDALREILAHAERAPAIRVGIECEPGFFLGATPALQRLLGEVDHPLLGANLDLGHACCSGEDPAEAIVALGPRIWNIHIEDIKGRVHEHLIPGLGDMDFPAIRAALDRIGYRGMLTLELYPYKDDPSGAGARGLAALRRHF